MTFNINSLRDARHIDKTFYIGVDKLFYERNYNHYQPTFELREIVEGLIESDGSSWDIVRSDVWTHVFPGADNPNATELLRQGWKIHVSATNLNCEDVLRRAGRLAIERCIQFKFANDIETLRMMTSKRWPRGGSGKFITLYPGSDSIFREFLAAASEELDGFEGSYILSDRRYMDSKCLYYRYGGMRSSSRLDLIGRRIEYLTSPDGDEIIDRRNAFYEVPAWEREPFADDKPDEFGELTLNAGRFEIKSALAYSNTGGVYLATDTTNGETVVIKEARPGVELGQDGQDAISRLEQEAKMLQVAEQTNVVPKLIATFRDWENFYLVEEHLVADDMRMIMLANTPLLKVAPTREDSEAFYEIYRKLFISLLEAIALLHDAGIVVGDLSPTNILVERATGRVRIIDLEGAYRPSIDKAQDIHTPGFRADSENRNKNSDYDDDLYAIGVIMMYAMFPIAAMAFIRKDLFQSVLPVLVQDIGWARTPVLPTVRRLVANSISFEDAIRALNSDTAIDLPNTAPKTTNLTGRLDGLADGLARFITSNYRLDPAYTLFPIDPFGQMVNPHSFALGATGIMFALMDNGYAVPQPARDRFDRELQALDWEQLPPGLLTGKAGMAWGLLEMGDVDLGLRLLDSANTDPLGQLHHSLYYGMAGIGMANLAGYLRTGDEKYKVAAERLAGRLQDTAIADERGISWRPNDHVQIGYGYGQSGVALFLLRLAQMNNDDAVLDLGRAALRFDLSYGVEFEPGAISFGESPTRAETLEQYIEQGSGGIAKVAIRYGMWDEVEGLLTDIHRKYSCFAGLIYGLSGFVDVLVDAYIYSGDPKYLRLADRPLEGLVDLYLFETEHGYAAPGENLFRISCDHATGLAGILQTLVRRRDIRPDTFCLDAMDQKVAASLCTIS